VWSVISVDEELGLVYLPTGNAAPDYWAAGRNGNDYWSASVVALHASTGEVAWRFQTVHHDVWDFDLPAQPTLVTLRRDGADVPALVQPTKMGILFVLDRRTGESLFPIEERPVPQTDVPGEITSPTQPFPVAPPPLTVTTLDPDDAFGLLGFDRRACRETMKSLRWDGMYTPPSLQGSLMFPGNAGGTNWGGIAVDPTRSLAVANVMNLAWSVRLIPRQQFDAARAAEPDIEISALRHAARDDRLAARHPLHAGAVGDALGGRSRAGDDPLAGHARNRRAGRQVGRTQHRRAGHHRGWARLHRRRHPGQPPARVRPRDRRRALERAAARGPAGDADDLSPAARQPSDGGDRGRRAPRGG
jgi:hypothetical protein